MRIAIDDEDSPSVAQEIAEMQVFVHQPGSVQAAQGV